MEDVQGTEVVKTEETISEKETVQQEVTVKEPEKIEEVKDEPRDPSWYKKRIDRFTRDKYEKEAKIAYLEARLKKYEGGTTTIKAPLPQDFVDAYGEINQEAYQKKHQEYLDNYLNHKKDQEVIQDLERQAKDRYQNNVDRLNAQVASLRNDIPDIDVSIAKLKVSPELDVAILECEDSAKVADYLGRNEVEVERLKKMTPYQMGEYLGRIEEKLHFVSKKVSKATEPITPLAGANGEVDKPEEQMTDQEWADKRKRERELKFRKG